MNLVLRLINFKVTLDNHKNRQIWMKVSNNLFRLNIQCLSLMRMKTSSSLKCQIKVRHLSSLKMSRFDKHLLRIIGDSKVWPNWKVFRNLDSWNFKKWKITYLASTFPQKKIQSKNPKWHRHILFKRSKFKSLRHYFNLLLKKKGINRIPKSQMRIRYNYKF